MCNVKNRVSRFSTIALLGAALAAALLAGCTMSDDQMARFVVAPGKYTLYSCEEIARETQTKAAREQELQQLRARASTDSGGQLISSVAYDPDYLTVRGELNELRKAVAEKNCAAAPGAAPPAPTARSGTR